MSLVAELAERFAGRRVLITGGLGFLGSNVARVLVETGASVRLVDSLMPTHGGTLANLDGFRSKVEVDVFDIRESEGLAERLRGRDVLFNLAGQTSHLDSMTDPDTDLEINCRAQLSLLEACRAHNPELRIVYASTRQVYGRPQYLPVDESHPLDPVDLNGVNKLAGEWYHTLYGRVYGLQTSVLRLTNTYGPRMRVRDARQTFLGEWIRRALCGEELLVYGDGSQRRDLSYADDAVAALLLAATDERALGQVLNVGADGHVSLAELAGLVTEIAGSGSVRTIPFPADRLAIDIGDYYADDAKLRALGWRPETPLEEGLARTLDYYRGREASYWERAAG